MTTSFTGSDATTGSPWYQEGKFYVSPHNFADELRAEVRESTLPLRDRIYDSTIRKLLLVPGLPLTTSDLMRVADALDRLGVRHVNTNIHWWGEKSADPLEWSIGTSLLTGGFRFQTHITLDNFWADDWKLWVERLAALGMDDVTYFYTPPRADSGGRVDAAVHDRLQLLAEETVAMGLAPSVMFGDVARAHYEDLVGLCTTSDRVGMTRIGVADSVSCLTHHAMIHLLRKLRTDIGSDIPFLIHTHDDLGLGTATAVDVLTNGDLVEVSLNGLSDRAGFPALEEVVAVLEAMYGLDSGMDLEHLSTACQTAAQVGITPEPHKAISGRHAFMLDLPYAVEPTLGRGRYDFPPAWTCIDPTWVGSRFDLKWLRQFLAAPVLGAKLRSLGLPDDDESIAKVKVALNERLASLDRYPVWLSEDEVEATCWHLLGRSATNPRP